MPAVRLAVAFAALAILAPLAACSSSQDEGAASGDNDLTQKQLTGSSLPPMTLALTFDDGPGKRTSELSTYLKEQGIQVGFFMEGQHAQGHEDLMRQVNDDGHVIGNHTWDHPLLTKITQDQVYDELKQTHDVLEPFYKDGIHMFRAPYGGWSGTIADGLNQTELNEYVGSIFWNIGGDLTETHAADWACWGSADLSVEECGDRYLQEIHDRGDHGVVLMHDIHSKTIDMVKYLVPKLKDQGYAFVRVDQVPDIHAQLVDKGASPLPAVTSPPESASSQSESFGEVSTLDDGALLAKPCTRAGVFCGGSIGGDPAILYRCTAKQLAHVCKCAAPCGVGANGKDGACACDPAASEPGLPDAPGSPTHHGAPHGRHLEKYSATRAPTSKP